MVRLRCKSWQCPYCAKENRREWREHLRKVLPQITENWWFVTLTAHEKDRTAAGSLQNLRANIERLFKRIRRVWKSVEYVRVYEPHKKGAYHAHLLVSGLSARVQRFETPQGVEYWREAVFARTVGNLSVRTWLSRTARSMEMGYMVDVQEVHGITQPVSYVVKYLTAEKQAFWVKSLRRVQPSRRIGSPKHPGDGTWSTGGCVFRGEVPQGARLYDASLKLWVPEAYWRENLTYPKTE